MKLLTCKLFPTLGLCLLAAPTFADSTPVLQGDTAHPYKFLVISSTDHITGLTGQATALLTALHERKNAAATSVPTGTLTEEDSTSMPGWYDYTPSALDVNTLGSASFHTAVTGSDPVDFSFNVVAVNSYDASLFGLTGIGTLAGQNTITGKTNLIATNAGNSPNEITAQGSVSALLLSLATYQSVLTAGSTSSVLSTALVGTADLTGSKVVFTTGVNKGVTRTITSMNSGTGAINLLTATPNTPGATDAFSVVQGSKALEQFLAALGTDSKPFLTATDTQAQAEAGTALTAYGAATGTQVAALPAANATAVWGSTTRALTDKANFALVSTEYANIAAVTSTYGFDGPPAGTILTLTITRNSSSQPVLTWTADPAATLYKVYRSTDGANYTVIATPATGTLTYTDTARPAGATVYYHITSTH